MQTSSHCTSFVGPDSCNGFLIPSWELSIKRDSWSLANTSVIIRSKEKSVFLFDQELDILGDNLRQKSSVTVTAIKFCILSFGSNLNHTQTARNKVFSSFVTEDLFNDCDFLHRRL